MDWTIVIGLVALLFSLICFYLFVSEATRKAVPKEVVDEAEKRAQANLSPAALGALAKALAEAFSKVGPAALALIGAILFLLLAGEALGVFHLTDEKECAAKQAGKGETRIGKSGGSDAGNSSGEGGNQTGNVQ